MKLLVDLVEPLQELGHVRLLEPEPHAAALLRVLLEHVIAEARRMIVREDNHRALNGRESQRHLIRAACKTNERLGGGGRGEGKGGAHPPRSGRRSAGRCSSCTP
eukprot:5109877-Pleurochrysis_carterae.AAC.1